MILSPRRCTPTWALYHSEALASYRPERPDGMNAHMLIEDLSHRHYAYHPALRFDSDDPGEGERFVSELLTEFSQYRGGHADHRFWDLLNSIVYELYQYGRCTGELFLDRPDPNEQDSTEHPRLAVVPQWSLQTRRRSLRQRSPEPAVGWSDLRGATLLDLTPDIAFTRSLRRTQRRLAAIDMHTLSRSDLLTTRAPDYDFSLHQRKLAELSARATADVGWDGRGIFMERATNSLRVYRELRFASTWLTLVNTALTAVNEACRLSEWPSAPRSVELSGIPTASELEAAMESVVNGSESLDDISNRLLHPPRP